MLTIYIGFALFAVFYIAVAVALTLFFVWLSGIKVTPLEPNTRWYNSTIFWI